jgi:ADP-ribose pyrophosphatase
MCKGQENTAMTEERVVDTIDIFEGKVVNLKVDTIELRDGHRYKREIVYHNGAVAAVALDPDNNTYLVKQYRTGAKKYLLEIPAGGLEPGEEREECARRELQEEIGYFPDELVELGGFYVAASYNTEYITIYLARNLRPSQLEGDVDEYIDVEKLPFEDVLAMALSNEIEDSKTIIGILWAAKHLGML